MPLVAGCIEFSPELINDVFGRAKNVKYFLINLFIFYQTLFKLTVFIN
jgi:hypothetical protein